MGATNAPRGGGREQFEVQEKLPGFLEEKRNNWALDSRVETMGTVLPPFHGVVARQSSA